MGIHALRSVVLALSCVVLLSGCPISQPVADAGPDKVVREGESVTIQGKGTDVDGTIKSYKWAQIAGPTVKFKQTKDGTLTFTAPDVKAPVKLEFALVVIDDHGIPSVPDTVLVTVNLSKFFGTAPSGPEDYEHLLAYFDQLTPENAGKWGSVESTRDEMNWTELDAAYEFAKTHKLPFKFHTLIWGQQQPEWMSTLEPAEQLEEIEEWMKLVSKRYKDLPMIDVVNEPLNAPAGYREALGGAGETGYDWVINAFKMARKYFPKSQLILNEYNTLILEPFTDNYLVVINLLKERGLIDAIGEQAHFLERADIEVVAANLNKLAATGLPIYISELDLNFADDARQANVMRDLFSLFWDHPAVAGITHWGHLQGSIWRTNGYLIRSDGSARPALDWIMCYMDGGGDDCTVPDYIPSGWEGTSAGLTLEAEEYDEGEGVAALGNVVAYTDDGDWIAFYDVNFQQGWDTFWLTYAKGNTEVGSISVHIDGLDNPAALTIPVAPTGGWGSNQTIEAEWIALTGSHDVFIRFNDVEGGVANLDNVRFGRPADGGTNLVANGTFESNTAGWASWNGATLSSSADYAHSGTRSLLAANRPNTNQFAVYNLTGSVQPGMTYAVNAWTLINAAAPDTVRLAAKVECTAATAPAGHNTYPWLQSNSAVQPGVWTQLSGTLVIPDCDLVDVAIFFEGTAVGIDVYVDDVEVLAPASDNLISDGGFETGIAGWTAWNGATLSASTAQAHTGDQSLFATNRPDANQFAVYNLTSAVTPNSVYAVSGWAFITGADPGTVRLAAKVECTAASAPSGHNTYPWLQNNTSVVPGTWTQLSANLTIPDCDLVDVAIFFEGTAPGTDVYLDDVSVAPL